MHAAEGDFPPLGGTEGGRVSPVALNARPMGEDEVRSIILRTLGLPTSCENPVVDLSILMQAATTLVTARDRIETQDNARPVRDIQSSPVTPLAGCRPKVTNNRLPSFNFPPNVVAPSTVQTVLNQPAGSFIPPTTATPSLVPAASGMSPMLPGLFSTPATNTVPAVTVLNTRSPPPESEVASAIETLTAVFGTDFQLFLAQRAAAASVNTSSMSATRSLPVVNGAGSPTAPPFSGAISGTAPTEVEAPGAHPRFSAEEQQRRLLHSGFQARVNSGPMQLGIPTSLTREEQSSSDQSADFKPTAAIPMPYCQFKSLQHLGQFSTSAPANANVLPSGFKTLNISGKNLNKWVKNVQLILMREGVLSLLLDPPPKPWTLEIDLLHHKAFCILLSSIDPALYPSIPHGLTIGEVWQKLIQWFCKNSNARRRISREFYSAKLKEGVDMSEHLCELNEIREELILRGEHVSERSLISIIINSLGPSWDNFISQLDSISYETLSLEVLSDKLIAEDKLRKERAASVIPQRYEDVFTLSDREQQNWRAAMDTELQSLKKLEVFTPTELPRNQKVIGTRWIFKKKPIGNGQFIYKARLVTQGFSQRFPDNYVDTFSPTVWPESVKTALTIAAIQGENVYQFDIQTAYLHAKLDQKMYVRAPQGVDHQESGIWLLNKSLYGFKQSGRRWYEGLTSSLNQMGFKISSADECVFIKNHQGIKETVLVYVDDILYVCKCEDRCKMFSKELSKNFALKPLGRIANFLGVQFVKTEKGYKLSQQDKITELIERCNMTEARPCDTPMQTDFLENMYVESEAFEQKTLYKSVIGSLLYIAGWTRPDISLTVNVLSRHSENPTQYHWSGIKRVLRYLKKTVNYSLLLEPDVSDKPSLCCYSDADWAGDFKSRKSILGYVILLNGSPIYWYSDKEKLIVTSTAEAEYVCLSKASNNLVWFDDLLINLWEKPVYPIDIYEDNMAAINISRADAVGQRSRHIDIYYKHVRQLTRTGFIRIVSCETKEQMADLLTKPLPRDQHQYLLDKISMTM
ncbi:uncharacterized protein LOC132712152 [Pantherophis guttatus]|uniref:Uncharacterized protein LOC132712152 n=1 Tax=Pantherophis guttatus TaxID=94885 RepID=A0ABM3ZJX8_PANGU|nr:uncharacterized protein LOC132712152 [Pantherophis guttatus]XP_060548681.1 uncharacterized protein LOC132712152 [Pantherophis guttatus]